MLLLLLCCDCDCAVTVLWLCCDCTVAVLWLCGGLCGDWARYVMEKFNTTLVEIMRDGGHFAAQENPAAVFRSFKNFADALL